MDNISFLDMVLRLGAAVALGGLIGLEREAHERPAGLRTHILVCMGATLFTLSSYMLAGGRFDPGRVTAQIVTGIGFLGAGTIIHQGSIVRGLTTAASIWTVAAIGVAVGIGGTMLYLAIIATIFVIVTLTMVGGVERYLLMKPHERTLSIRVRGDGNALCTVLDILGKHGTEVRMIGSSETAEGMRNITVKMSVPRNFNETQVGTELAEHENVISYTWRQA